MAKLSLTSFQGGQSGTVYEYAEGVVRIGRDPDNEIVLADSTSVSRRHAEIKCANGSWRVVDLKSTNGTLLNRQRVTESALRNGDELQFGAEGPRLRVSLVGGSSETSMDRDAPAGEPTYTELFPIHMGLEPIKGKGFLVPAGIAVLGSLAILTTAASGDIRTALTVTQLLFAAATVALIYHYCGKTKPIWVFVGCGLITGVVLAGFHSEIHKLFENFVPAKAPVSGGKAPVSIIREFVAMLFSAAIPEELEKILPAMLGLWLFVRSPSQRRVSPLQNDLMVREPLDGILMGVAAAAGFSVLEGVLNPVSTLVQDVTMLTAGAGKQLIGPLMNAARAGESTFTQVFISQLLPLLMEAAKTGIGVFAQALYRGIGDISGHQAYSGIFGYYVGLSALYPAQRNKLILRGFITAILFHALWNTMPEFSRAGIIGPTVAYVGAAALVFCSLAFLIACILQARKISPSRASNFATNLSTAK